jgi:hypothetical protein
MQPTAGDNLGHRLQYSRALDLHDLLVRLRTSLSQSQMIPGGQPSALPSPLGCGYQGHNPGRSLPARKAWIDSHRDDSQQASRRRVNVWL